MTTKRAVGVFAALGITALVVAFGFGGQLVAQVDSKRISRKDIAVGPSKRASKVYDQYASQWLGRYGYELSPFVVTQIQTPAPKPLGPARRLTDVEYSRLILSTLAVPPIEPITSRSPGPSIVQQEVSKDGLVHYKPVQARVAEVFNRGIMLLESGEDLRLRGVRMFSERDPDDVIRYYMREGIRRMRELTRQQPLRIVFDEPLRDPDGNLLGTVSLPDGTDLNRYMLEQGYGYVEPADFLPFQDLTEYYAAERTARDAKRGIWSRK